MSGNTFGKIFKITTFGESHGRAIGVIIDGVPAQLDFDLDFIQSELDRRKPGQSKMTTARSEADKIEVMSGVFENKTTGTSLAMMIFNQDQHSKDYSNIASTYRSGHADFTYDMKYGFRDYRGGGRSSGRETAARVAAGAVAKLILRQYGVNITAGAVSIGNVCGEIIDLSAPEKNVVRAFDPNMADEMEREVASAASCGDSVGGVVACFADGVPSGLGEPVFDKLDALLAHAMLSLGSVKGIEFGNGFEASRLRGSENNDRFIADGKLETNRCGGVLGGISTGSRIEFKVAVKPTPSVSIEQQTIDKNLQECTLKINGRHDPCIVPRIVPVVEAMTAIVLCDLLLCARSSRMK
ncbi:MAG: chorismate synthase [Lentisphaerae bacterium]|nr:chorismate synthase [Lentisphaerota bacterium]